MFDLALQPDAEEEGHHANLRQEGKQLGADGEGPGPGLVDEPEPHPDEEVAEQVGEVERFRGCFRQNRKDDEDPDHKESPGGDLHRLGVVVPRNKESSTDVLDAGWGESYSSWRAVAGLDWAMLQAG